MWLVSREIIKNILVQVISPDKETGCKKSWLKGKRIYYSWVTVSLLIKPILGQTFLVLRRNTGKEKTYFRVYDSQATFLMKIIWLFKTFTEMLVLYACFHTEFYGFLTSDVCLAHNKLSLVLHLCFDLTPKL